MRRAVLLILAMLALAGPAPAQSPAPAPSASPPQAPTATPAPTPPSSPTPRRTDTQTQQRDKGIPILHWVGAHVLGLDSRLRISGFVEVDALNSSGTMGSKGMFITSTIATGDKAPRVRGDIDVDANPTRLVLDSRSQLGHRQLTAYAAFDAFRHTSSLSPRVRLREGYLELTDALFGGTVQVGQAWSSISDVEAYPDTLDFEGPNSFVNNRIPLVRWSRDVAPSLRLLLSAEMPYTHIVQNAVSRQGRPDYVAALTYDRQPLRLQASFMSRELVAGSGDVKRTAPGWGASISGTAGIRMGRLTDTVSFSTAYGRGYGSSYNDAPPDAVFVSAPGGGSLSAIPASGWFVGYQHAWTSQLSSTIVHGALDVDNLSVQPGSSLRKTTYDTLNLVWRPDKRWMLGIEGQWGSRVDLDGAAGRAFRTQVSTRYTF